MCVVNGVSDPGQPEYANDGQRAAYKKLGIKRLSPSVEANTLVTHRLRAWTRVSDVRRLYLEGGGQERFQTLYGVVRPSTRVRTEA